MEISHPRSLPGHLFRLAIDGRVEALQLSSNCFTKTMITQASMLPRDRFHGSLSATMSTNDNESLLEVTQRPESALFSLRSFPARYVAGFGLTSEPLER